MTYANRLQAVRLDFEERMDMCPFLQPALTYAGLVLQVGVFVGDSTMAGICAHNDQVGRVKGLQNCNQLGDLHLSKSSLTLGPFIKKSSQAPGT